MNDYERARAEKIAENKARMKALGLVDARDAIARGAREDAARKRQRRVMMMSTTTSAPTTTTQPRRASRRQQGEAPEQFDPANLSSARDLFEPAYAEELYDDAHVEALGAREREWTLFVDGYDERGRRIYDPVNGQCCHQCRQKTKGLRTACAGCGMMRGVYCGDCLYMRHGENIEEATAKGDAWRCPSCRDICNCSFCRTKKGYPPTGSMYRRALAMGYDSVAHYLVLTNQRDEAKRAAAERAAAVKAKAFAEKMAAEEAENTEEDAKENVKPHWLQGPKVYANE